MADPSVCLTSTNFTHPRIIFIRLGKDKTKDAIQNKVFKSVRKALKDLGSKESDLKPAKNVLVLSSIASRGIQDIAIGGEYVGLLLKDGRVCRFKCSCKSTRSLAKGKNTAVSDEPIFQVQSDEAYARRLQDQLNTGAQFGDLNNTGDSTFGFAQEPFRFGSLENEPEVSLLNFGDSNFENLLSKARETNSNQNESQNKRTDKDKGSAKTKTTSSNVTKENSSTSNTETPRSENTSSASSSSKLSSNSDSLSVSLPKSSFAAPSKTATTSTGAATENLSSKSDSSLLFTNSSSKSSPESTVNQPRSSSSVTNLATTRPNTQTTGYLAQRPPPSPTVVHRTILTADPILLRTSQPYYLRSHILIPNYPQISSPLYTFDPRRLNSSFSSRNQVRLFQRSNRRQLSSPYTRRNQESNTARGDVRNSIDQSTDEASSDFNYPDIGEIEWLQLETGEDVKFSHIAALHTEFLLVEKDTGCLYHWPYSNNVANQVPMETDVPDIDFSEAADLEVPKAKVSPLVTQLQLENEQVVLLAAHSIRCTLVTKSGKVCTFYDNFFKENNNEQPPALIQQLSHAAVEFPELKGETITAVDCCEFFSSVMTKNGKIYWWGLLPSEERQDFKQKQNKESNNIFNISVNDKVQLRKHLPGFPGALVFKPSETYGPQLGRLLSHETDGTPQSAMKIKVEKIPSKPVSPESSRSDSPIISVPSRIDPLSAKGSASPMHTMLQEARSASPHTNIKNLESQTRSNPNIEIWDVNDVVFLESESKVLGTVAAIDGPHVIVKVDNSAVTTDSSLRVFKVSELESVSEESAAMHGASTSAISMTTMYRGCIQNTPKCILDATWTASDSKEVLTGVTPVAMATTSAGISILVEHQGSQRSIFIGPAVDPSNSEKVYTCCEDMTTSRGSDDGCTTVDCESIPSIEAALNSVSVCPDTRTYIGHKRKRVVNEGVSTEEHVPLSSMTPSKVAMGDTQTPSLHKTTGSNVILLCDNNGCLYPRPFGTKLSEPCAIELPPLHCLGVGHRLGFTSKCDAEEKVLTVFLAFKDQKLISAIQSGVVSNVTDILDELEALHTKNYKGKSIVNGSKKVAVEGTTEKPLATAKTEHNDNQSGSQVFSQTVMNIINEHTSSNQNVLHVACTNPSYISNNEQAKKPLETLLKNIEDSGGSSRRWTLTLTTSTLVFTTHNSTHMLIFAEGGKPENLKKNPCDMGENNV